MNNKFSENLKKIRKENNLSQEQLADELGVSRQAISKWESASAYPEMDKIIMICDKFNVNIDDLLHKDIKEVKSEEESKKKLNNYMDDFLSFITNTVNLFSKMTFKSKIKCIIEQIIIILVLLIFSRILTGIITSLFLSILRFLPPNVTFIIQTTIESILYALFAILSIIIIVHVFKTRYLDYYTKNQKETKEEKDSSEEKKESNKENTTYKKQEDKIIIRDPKHSEYRFIHGLFKCMIVIFKFFLLWFAIGVSCTLIGLFIAFILSFLLYKTGLFFLGILATILSSAIITILILLLVLNFIFNRKSDKKKIIGSFILSLIVFGIGCGLIFVGTLDFEIQESTEDMLKVETIEHDMKDNLVIYPHTNIEVDYIESDIDNVKIEYTINKFCNVDENVDEEETNITAWVYCQNPTKIAKEFIKNLNKKKIIPIRSDIEKITVYASSANIEKLQENWNNVIETREKEAEINNSYENRINELEKENTELKDKIAELETQDN